MRHHLPALSCASVSADLSRRGRAGHCGVSGAALHAATVKLAGRIPPWSPDYRHALVAWNALVSMYAKSGLPSHALKVFDEIPLRDAVSWNSILAGCDLAGALRWLRRMRRVGECGFDHATLTTVLSACAAPESLRACEIIHQVAVSEGLVSRVQVGNALITAYFGCGCPASARKAFEGAAERNVITWTAMVSGLAQCGCSGESLAVFRESMWSVESNAMSFSSALLACSRSAAVSEGRQIHGLVVKAGVAADMLVDSRLMDLYSKCGMMDDAVQIFETCGALDVVSRTVILTGFAQNGKEEMAFDMFARIVREGLCADADVLAAVLGAFGEASSSGPFVLGKQIHALAIKKGFTANTFVCNGLINMYSKCGELGSSSDIFVEMPGKNSVSWNSAIAAMARHGRAAEAISYFNTMIAAGIKPTDVTFLSLLHACSHCGSPARGMEVLEWMAAEHGVAPGVKHYATVADMLGRAGQLREAKEMLERSPFRDEAQLWQALLGACSFHGDADVGEYAAARLVRADPQCAAAYVLLANIYSSQGRWRERGKVMAKMRDLNVRKDDGWSSVQHSGTD